MVDIGYGFFGHCKMMILDNVNFYFSIHRWSVIFLPTLARAIFGLKSDRDIFLPTSTWVFPKIFAEEGKIINQNIVFVEASWKIVSINVAKKP